MTHTASIQASGVSSVPGRVVFSPVASALKLLALAAFTLVVSACDSPEAATKPAAASARPPMPVSVLAVKSESLPLRIDAVGQAEGSKTVEIRARVNGVIEAILYTEGQALAVGDPMFQIERKPFEIALKLAKASMAQERAKVTQARRQLDRARALNKQQIVTRREYDDAVAAARTSAAALEVAQARVEEAELNLSYTLISAPIAGVSSRSRLSQGSLVSASSAEPLASLVSVDPVWVQFALNESQLLQVGEPSAAKVVLMSPGGKILRDGGRLNYSGSSVDLQLGTIALRAEFDNAQHAFLPGQFVQVRVVAGDRTAFLVPQTAVSQGPNGGSVWVVGDDGKAQPRGVKTAEWRGADWVIEGGLSDGEKVITNNLMKLRPGAIVNPVSPADQSKQQ